MKKTNKLLIIVLRLQMELPCATLSAGLGWSEKDSLSLQDDPFIDLGRGAKERHPRMSPRLKGKSTNIHLLQGAEGNLCPALL